MAGKNFTADRIPAQAVYNPATGISEVVQGSAALGANVNLDQLDTTNDAISAYVKASPVVAPLTASGQVLSGAGSIAGFYVNSTTAGTVRIANNTVAGSGYLGGVITPNIGWNDFPAEVTVGCYVTITGTIDVSFLGRLGATK